MHLQAQGSLNCPPGRDGLLSMMQETRGLMYSHPDSSEWLARQAITCAEKMRNDSLLMEAYFLFCLVTQMQTEFDTALAYTRKAGRIAFHIGSVHGQGEYYNLLARYHKYLNHPDSALYYLQVYDAYLEKQGSPSMRWLPQQETALFYMDFADWEKANFHIEEALKYVRMNKKPMDYPYVIYSAIDIYSRQENKKEKLSALTEEYLAYKVERGANILDTSMHMHLWLPLSDSTDKLNYLETVLPVHLANEDLLSAVNAYHTIGKIYATRSDYDTALNAYTASLTIANRLSYPNLRYVTHSILYALYDKLNRTSEALFHLKALNAVIDTIRNTEREELMHDLEVKYATAEKEYALSQANYQLENARKTQLFSILIGIALLLLLGMMLYAYRQKRSAAAQLSEKNAIISRALVEKDILLREIHHRVKNNLQMISALLYLHGKSVEDTSAQEALLESQNRVQSMAMIHQNLYQDSNLLGVGVKEYLNKLLSHLIASYNVEKDRIKINTHIEVEHLDVDTIVPLALIINELISNSLKYAFRDGRKGLIDVTLKNETAQILLEVRDNGMGLPAAFSIANSSNFGYKLISILSERLGADLTTSSANGTTISLSIPVRKAA